MFGRPPARLTLAAVLSVFLSPQLVTASMSCTVTHPTIVDSDSPWIRFDLMRDDHFKVFVCVLPMLVSGLISLIFAAFLFVRLRMQPTGDNIDVNKVDRLASRVTSGSMVFLFEEYKYLVVYLMGWAVMLVILFTADPLNTQDTTDGARHAACFILGAYLAVLSGFIGMVATTDGNVRTLVACAKGSTNDGLRVALMAGASKGFVAVGFASVGLSLVLICMKPNRDVDATVQYMYSFAFGVSTASLFARVAGSIFMQAADVRANAVVASGVNDPHRSDVFAVCVGDHVCGVAMGADLLESFVCSMLAAASMGANVSWARLALPMWLAGAGTIGGVVGFIFLRMWDEWSIDLSSLTCALERGLVLANFIFLDLAAIVIVFLFGIRSYEGWKLYGCVVIGHCAGVFIGKGMEYFASSAWGPARSIVQRSTTGPATVIIQGLGVGMISTILPIMVLAVVIVACAALADEYGVAVAVVGLLGTWGIALSVVLLAPVLASSRCLAEMSEFSSHVRVKTDALDALGRSVSAVGKGFFAASAVLSALVLLATVKWEAAHDVYVDLSVDDPILMGGILVGASLPYVFAALILLSADCAACEISEERWTNESVLALGDVEPDSVVTLTRAVAKAVIAPGMIAVLTPLILGFLVGPRSVMGLLSGCIGNAAMLALMLETSGSAWSSAKKCPRLGSGCVVGNAVGVPLKEGAGPTLRVLLKHLSMVSLIIMPLIQGKDDFEDWYVGLLPLALGTVTLLLLILFGVLSWGHHSKVPLSGNRVVELAGMPPESTSSVRAPPASPTGTELLFFASEKPDFPGVVDKQELFQASSVFEPVEHDVKRVSERTESVEEKGVRNPEVHGHASEVDESAVEDEEFEEDADPDVGGERVSPVAAIRRAQVVEIQDDPEWC